MDHDQSIAVLPNRPIGDVEDVTDGHVIDSQENLSSALKDLIVIHPPVDLSYQVTIPSYRRKLDAYGGFADVYTGEMGGKKARFDPHELSAS
jgi:hypothetical protein